MKKKPKLNPNPIPNANATSCVLLKYKTGGTTRRVLKYKTGGTTRHVLLKYNAGGTTRRVLLKYNARVVKFLPGSLFNQKKYGKTLHPLEIGCENRLI